MIPSTHQPFKFSRPALVLILASCLLAVILAVTTVRNLNREQRLLENSLLQQGLTLIRSFEAGARTSMMYHMSGSNPLDTLVEETTKEESVVYIRIIHENGETVAEAGDLPLPMDKDAVQRILDAESAVTLTIPEKSIFELARIFEPLQPLMPRRGRISTPPPPSNSIRGKRYQHMQMMQEELQKKGRQLIVVGLGTSNFDAARQEDKTRALLMGALLFLLGSAGLYFLFLYQSIRVGKSTLINMQLYTDNVIESMPAGLITLNSSNAIVSCNKKAEQLLSRRFSEMGNLKPQELFSSFTDDQQQDQLLVERDVLCHNPLGEDIPVKLSTSPLLDHNGKKTGLVIILKDMRDLRKVEQQLELSRRLASLGKMAAGVAHEIRNPLGTLRGFAQYFGNRSETGSDGKKYADLMASEVDRLNHTISSLLQFARAREPRRIPVKAGELFGKLSSLMEVDFAAYQIDFRKNYDPELLFHADPDLLLQVLLNLLKNSISVTENGGTIVLAAHRKNNDIWIQVSDTGHGMTDEEQEKLFDPFFSTRKDGTGLGLAVSHQIVEQHHGRIEVESTLGKGTTMKIILPGGPV
ncbi:MAG: PAS domain-containing protein [Desulfocapsa sp.]|nr:PAS domain-containing protein [Desulfocapsa sp.]